MSIHNYVLTTDFSWTGAPAPITDFIDPAQLNREIEASSIGFPADTIFVDEDADDVEITFTPVLSGPQVTALDAVVAAHTPIDPTPEDPDEGRPGLMTRQYETGVVVRDLVYQKTNGKVEKASCIAVSTSILAGFVEQIDFPIAGYASIRYLGDLSGFSGLTVGEIYLLGQTAGSIVEETDTVNVNYPDDTPQSGHTRYKVGLAATSSKLWVDISRGFDEF
jgi:hypothetical protein